MYILLRKSKRPTTTEFWNSYSLSLIPPHTLGSTQASAHNTFLLLPRVFCPSSGKAPSWEISEISPPPHCLSLLGMNLRTSPVQLGSWFFHPKKACPERKHMSWLRHQTTSVQRCFSCKLFFYFFTVSLPLYKGKKSLCKISLSRGFML